MNSKSVARRNLLAYTVESRGGKLVLLNREYSLGPMPALTESRVKKTGHFFNDATSPLRGKSVRNIRGWYERLKEHLDADVVRAHLNSLNRSGAFYKPELEMLERLEGCKLES